MSDKARELLDKYKLMPAKEAGAISRKNREERRERAIEEIIERVSESIRCAITSGETSIYVELPLFTPEEAIQESIAIIEQNGYLCSYKTTGPCKIPIISIEF